jgi:hypothetical protein
MCRKKGQANVLDLIHQESLFDNLEFYDIISQEGFRADHLTEA